MTTGPEPSDARLASDYQRESAPSRALKAYLLIAESSEVDANSRMSAAEKIIPLDRQAAARAFQAIALSSGVDVASRMSAAEKIIPLDSAHAVQALNAIAGTPGVTITQKITAAGLMVPLDSAAAAAMLKKLSAEFLRSASQQAAEPVVSEGETILQRRGVPRSFDARVTGGNLNPIVPRAFSGSPVRRATSASVSERLNAIFAAIDKLAKSDPHAAAEIFYEFAAATIDPSYRLAAADRIAKLEAG